MQLIVCTDIFGDSSELQTLLSDLELSNFKIHVISPYSDTLYQNTVFDDESNAYDAFTSVGGVEAYAKHIEQFVRGVEQRFLVLGFSAGGAASWVAQNELPESIKACLLFYPGQIRHYTSLKAKSPVDIVFPGSEKHFELSTVISELEGIDGLSIKQCQYSHGFMNRLSENFNENGYAEYLQHIRQWLLIHLQVIDD